MKSMVYYINGERFTYSEAVCYLVNLAASRVGIALDVLTNAIRDLLFTIRPGTGREYANARISCECMH